MSETYDRIRAACCGVHGLGGITGDTYRDDPKLLDQHARYIAKLVAQARELHAKTTERSTA